MLKRLASHIRSTFGKPSKTTQQYALRSAEEFSQILEFERHRADRTNGLFSLLAFDCGRGLAGHAIYACLDEILRRRLRLTDTAGWLDARRIGVILPCTAAAGAWIVAEDVCRQVPAHLLVPSCTVMCYPSNSPDQIDNARNGFKKVPKQNGERQPHPDERPVGAMEALFVAHTPSWKRLVDVGGASAGLILLSPLLLLTALAVKCTSSGPVFFAQERTGLGGRRFRIYKFRSMVVNAESLRSSLMALNEQDGPAFKLKNDPRVTRIGRLLRRTCIDELPQLWNVIRGDMSLVGPRPLPCHESNRCDQWQRRHLDVSPGLTCIWQLFGGTHVTFDEWMRMDLKYARSRTLWRDLRLVTQTVQSILSGKKRGN